VHPHMLLVHMLLVLAAGVLALAGAALAQTGPTPVLPPVVVESGRGIDERRRTEEEAREAERAVELSPQDATLRVWLGSVRERRGDREGARRAYEQALALAPGDRTATKYLQRLRGASSLAGPGPGGV